MYQYLAEFLGTLFLVYIYLATANPLAIGAAYALAILITNNSSGGHLNPAVPGVTIGITRRWKN